MHLSFVEHNGIKYPAHEVNGNAARHVMGTAKDYCVGKGVDIGYSKEEWKLPGAIGVEPTLNEWDAMNFPFDDIDYVFSSHCLEHVKENWYNVIDYWLSKIKVGGILFLYLPHMSQTYWHPSSNRKHIHSFSGREIDVYLSGLGHKVFVGGCDANHSFVVICEKVQQETIKELDIEAGKIPFTICHYPGNENLFENFKFDKKIK